MRVVYILSIWCVVAWTATGQPVRTIDEVIAISLQQSPLLKAHAGQIALDRLQEKSAWHLPDPELLLESPTGDFMTLGVQQRFEFPLVYVRQRQLAKQQTILSEKSSEMAAGEITRKVREAYLELQYSLTIWKEEERLDSVFSAIANAAQRQYAAGQIDFVEKSYTDIKYAEIHAAYLSARVDVEKAQQRLMVYTGMSEAVTPTPLEKEEPDLMISTENILQESFRDAPLIQFYRQAELLAEKEVRLEKSKVWPDFSIGYLNPADSNTPFPLRLQAGLSVPLWFWQYGTSVKASKTKQDMASQYTMAGQQEMGIAWTEYRNQALQYSRTISFYEQESLPLAASLIEASDRMFTAGQYDFIKYLTTLADAYQVQAKYLSAIKAYNQAIIQLQYLIGK